MGSAWMGKLRRCRQRQFRTDDRVRSPAQPDVRELALLLEIASGEEIPWILNSAARPRRWCA